MFQGPLCPNLSQKVQKEVSQMANHNLSHVILLGGLSVNLNHLKTNDCNLIYEFNKRTTLSIKVFKSEKRLKKAVIQPLKVVLVEQGSTITTHIYSREK